MKNTKLITNVMVLAAAALLLISATGCDHSRYSFNVRNDHYSPPVRQETHYTAPKVTVTDRRDDRHDRDDHVVVRDTNNRDRDNHVAVRTDNTRTAAVDKKKDTKREDNNRVTGRTDDTRTTAATTGDRNGNRDSRDKNDRTTVRNDKNKPTAGDRSKEDQNRRDNKRRR